MRKRTQSVNDVPSAQKQTQNHNLLAWDDVLGVGQSAKSREGKVMADLGNVLLDDAQDGLHATSAAQHHLDVLRHQI